MWLHVDLAVHCKMSFSQVLTDIKNSALHYFSFIVCISIIPGGSLVTMMEHFNYGGLLK